jgi:hypothetical protein
MNLLMGGLMDLGTDTEACYEYVYKLSTVSKYGDCPIY